MGKGRSPQVKFQKKIKKIKIRFFSAEKFAVSTKIGLYRPVGMLPYLSYTLPKNRGLNRRFEKSKCFYTFYIYLTLFDMAQKKRLHLKSLLICNDYKFILFPCLISFLEQHQLTWYCLVVLQHPKISIELVFLLVSLRF